MPCRYAACGTPSWPHSAPTPTSSTTPTTPAPASSRSRCRSATGALWAKVAADAGRGRVAHDLGPGGRAPRRAACRAAGPRRARRRRPHRAAVPLHRRAAGHPRHAPRAVRRGASDSWPGCTPTPSWPTLLGPPTTTADCFREVWLRAVRGRPRRHRGLRRQGPARLPVRRGRRLGVLVDALDDPGPCRRPRRPVARELPGRARPALAARLGGPVGRRPRRRRRDPPPRRPRHRPAPLAGRPRRTPSPGGR